MTAVPGEVGRLGLKVNCEVAKEGKKKCEPVINNGIFCRRKRRQR